MNLPEPSGKIVYPSQPYAPEWVSSQDAYSEEQMREYRNQALEEAVTEIERHADLHIDDIVAAIRALKEQK